uniref:C-type lectin domain-containing protein n=1 Tax=Knipowitschia caucasica TaxID=637954 RepID=A0AAV2JII6_KNICA
MLCVFEASPDCRNPADVILWVNASTAPKSPPPPPLPASSIVHESNTHHCHRYTTSDQRTARVRDDPQPHCHNTHEKRHANFRFGNPVLEKIALLLGSVALTDTLFTRPAVILYPPRGPSNMVDYGIWVFLLGHGTIFFTFAHGLNQYYFIDKSKSWSEAQQYCREHFTDLATIERKENLSRVHIPAGQVAWIGLHDDPAAWFQVMTNASNSWRWSPLGPPALEASRTGLQMSQINTVLFRRCASCGHYEVHGDDIAVSPVARTGNHMTVFIAELNQGKLRPARMVVVRLLEFEATITGILAKIHDALQCEDPFVLTDAQGNEIVDSEGTRGSKYWRQNAKKCFAVPEQVLHQFQQGTKGKKQTGQRERDSTGLLEVHEKIEEVVLAAQSLTGVTSVMKDLATLASSTVGNVLLLSNTLTIHVKDAFRCIVCRGLMEEPVFAVCCKRFVGCHKCVDQWLLTSEQCLKCRAEDFEMNIHRVACLDTTGAIRMD